jgi:hypothetical protein
LPRRYAMRVFAHCAIGNVDSRLQPRRKQDPRSDAALDPEVRDGQDSGAGPASAPTRGGGLPEQASGTFLETAGVSPGRKTSCPGQKSR